MSTITHEGNGRMATFPINTDETEHALPGGVDGTLVKAATVGTTADRLKSFVSRIERLEEEKRSIADDIKEVYGEAAGEGFDVKVLRKLIALRKQDPEAVAEQAEILELYMSAIGE